MGGEVHSSYYLSNNGPVAKDYLKETTSIGWWKEEIQIQSRRSSLCIEVYYHCDATLWTNII